MATAPVAVQSRTNGNPFESTASKRPAGGKKGRAPRSSAARTTGGSVYYANCSAARAAGAAPVRRGEPGYSRKLDRDNDGVGCE
ncbi:excalibur calcium-binding domain-containing protein [Sphingomonas sp.]|uniref:excalibur calcium-binding domain-containing protein n=1 Tax=Sphingomonas sp. TaxID=28214 RepID=UPI0025E2ACD0|nr:excalibur calcium-binding domain-containing protein [Sphingomonas sp.]